MGLVKVDNVAGWVRFDDVGHYLGGPVGLVPYSLDTSGFFDSIKRWGANLAKKAKAFGKKVQGVANKVLNNPIVNQAKAWISTIPVYGQFIGGALGAAQSLAGGKGVKDVLLDAAQSAVPGGLGKTIFGAARGILDSALKGGGPKSVLANAAKVGAGLVVDKLAANPALRGLATKALAQVSGVGEEEAQLAQAAILHELAPNAPAFPAGVSLDDGAALLDFSATPTSYEDARAVIEPPRALSLTAELALMQLVPALRRADERLRRLVVKGSLVGPGSNGGEAAGLEGDKYRVESGDYGGRIVAKLGHPGEVAALIAANPGVNLDKIYPGQLLHLPPGWGGSPVPAPLPADGPGPSPAPTSSSPGRLYTVVPGDYGERIAARFGLGPSAVPELIAANPGVDLDHIYPGQTLAIPASWPPLGGGPAPVPDVPPPGVEPEPDPVPAQPEPYDVPLPEVLDPYVKDLPVPGIPSPPFDQLPLPDGPVGPTRPPVPPMDIPPLPDGPLNVPPPWIPTAAHIARAQAILAAWTTKYPSAASPADYGRVQGDLSATWTARSAAICKSYQLWANQRGAALRVDGILDKPTYTSLENTFVDIVKSTPQPQPAPSTPSGGTSRKSGGGLAALAAAAALLL